MREPGLVCVHFPLKTLEGKQPELVNEIKRKTFTERKAVNNKVKMRKEKEEETFETSK